MSTPPTDPQPPARMPRRWVLIVFIAAVCSVPAGLHSGPAAAVAAFFVVAVALHVMVE
ncbi:hypothetical protein [Mangrovactinospora gilvigrisea]|uniref:hypothetical protein n=1 Tax=Mangrovactinospora gilvigrisea TaxID=1428644 RepID=UPI0015877354|nr:hypothetical protein [Mangrovactinospora gilvigrisea]